MRVLGVLYAQWVTLAGRQDLISMMMTRLCVDRNCWMLSCGGCTVEGVHVATSGTCYVVDVVAGSTTQHKR
jgi:hypothetical protein